MQNAPRRFTIHLTAFAAIEVVPEALLKLSYHKPTSRLLCPVLLHLLMLAELILPATSIMLVSSWFSRHKGTCQPKWHISSPVSLELPTFNITVQIVPSDSLNIKDHWELKALWQFQALVSAWTAMWNNSQTSGFGSVSPLFFRGWLLPTGLLWPLTTWKNMTLTSVKFISFRASLQTKLELYWALAQLLRFITPPELCKSFLNYSRKHNTWLLRKGEEIDVFWICICKQVKM